MFYASVRRSVSAWVKCQQLVAAPKISASSKPHGGVEGAAVGKICTSPKPLHPPHLNLSCSCYMSSCVLKSKQNRGRKKRKTSPIGQGWSRGHQFDTQHQLRAATVTSLRPWFESLDDTDTENPKLQHPFKPSTLNISYISCLLLIINLVSMALGKKHLIF